MMGERLPSDRLEALLRRTWSDPVAVTTPKAGTAFAVRHGLNRVPSQVIVTYKSAACDVYDAGSPGWTASTAYLKATVAGAKLKIAFR